MTNINVGLKMVIEAFVVMSRGESRGLIYLMKGELNDGTKN